jgi:DNA-binding MarR family transcriptional regulator
MTATATEQTTSELAARLRICLARLSRLSRTAPGAADLTPSQLSVLAAVEASPRQRIGDLAAGQNITAPSATRIVQGLVERGYIERQIDPDDKRACPLNITTEGRQALVTIRNQTTDLINRRLTDLPRDDQTSIRHAIAALERLAGLTTTDG